MSEGRGDTTAPALGVECRRKGGYKDDSEVGMSNRVNGIIISDMGALGRKWTCPVAVHSGVCPDLKPIRHVS